MLRGKCAFLLLRCKKAMTGEKSRELSAISARQAFPLNLVVSTGCSWLQKDQHLSTHIHRETIYYAKHGDQHCSRHGACGRGARARSCFCEASNSEMGGALRCASRLPDTHTIANYI